MLSLLLNLSVLVHYPATHLMQRLKVKIHFKDMVKLVCVRLKQIIHKALSPLYLLLTPPSYTYSVCITEEHPTLGFVGGYSGKHSVQQEISRSRWLVEKLNNCVSVQNNPRNATNITGVLIFHTDGVQEGGFSCAEHNHYCVSSDERPHKG